MRPRTVLVALGTAVLSAALVPGAEAADPEGRPEARPQAVAVPPRPETGPNGAGTTGNGTTGTATASGLRCLTRAEQRSRTAAKQVVPLARAAKAVKARHGELLRARLCEQNGRLVYLLTVLPRGGKLVRATVDAGTGTLISGP
ncbi:hypothetical protein PQJ75_11795 [Rhodoplanes sp. TEM]|uniref:PepSY domain-containing protein n=1 Tax=Rhodoplanes tepidamans TaxID=200616 RepID=A0ABT5JGE4_RHOTP|nr:MULTISPECIES: hypothetical protein [Rhodoplanes]MDC7788681.1 hypothetical protein [Rhodoplanes tepidamans]MDC7984415.1 hypothetical protein [Rhodoplanes sp. TEM]MDQ0358315.1 hypothetical protein [Rhodoplanes tepidamans]